MKHSNCQHKDVEMYSLLHSKKLPFNKDGKLFYIVMNMSKKLNFTSQNMAITEAFNHWNYHLKKYGKEFVECLVQEHTIVTDVFGKETKTPKAYIQIWFAGGDTGIMPYKPYDIVMGDPAMIAFWVPGSGDIFLNDGVEWDKSKAISLAIDPVDLLSALEHEIGHAQGIAHTKDNHNDIMFESYIPGNRITQDTIDALEEIYGVKTIKPIDILIGSVIIIFALSLILILILNTH